MSLPNRLRSARMTNATLGSSIDDEVGNLERALCDILGVPIDTDISAALFEVVAAGLRSVYFQDAAADPTVAGQLRRVGSELRFHNGAGAVTLGVPVGVITPYAGSSVPSGWLLCDGSAVPRTTYAALFAVIGTTYGAGDGSTTFNLPNLKGRFIVGQDLGISNFSSLGETGGNLTHAHDMTHSHTVNFNTGIPNEADAQRVEGAGSGLPGPSHIHAVNGTTSTVNTNTASNSSLPPYLTLRYLIKS